MSIVSYASSGGDFVNIIYETGPYSQVRTTKSKTGQQGSSLSSPIPGNKIEPGLPIIYLTNRYFAMKLVGVLGPRKNRTQRELQTTAKMGVKMRDEPTRSGGK